MSFEFKHKNDYEVIIPREKRREGRDLTALIDLHFPESNDLIFCLLEMVTLRDLDAIGETYLFSTYSKKESQDVLNQYKEIVNRVISKFGLSIAEYLDWYRRSSYILMQSNGVEFSFPLQIPDWEQEPSSVENMHERSKFAVVIDVCLKENQIQEYLQFYASILHEEFGFREYPHYCIIVRPISVTEGNNEVIPLGNLYLHFAYAHEKDEKFFMHLINDFLIVWFKKKGVEVIRAIKDKTKVDIKKKKQKDYLPNFNCIRGEGSRRLSKKLHPVNKSLEDYYDMLFTNIEYKEKYCNKLQLLKEYLILKLSSLKNWLNQPATNPKPKFYDLQHYLGLDVNFFGVQGKSTLKQEEDLNHFMITLLRREFFKIGFIVFEINPNTLRNILMLMDPENDQKKLPSAVSKFNYMSPNADYTYLWTEMFIPWKKFDNINTSDFAHYSKNIEKLYPALRNRIIASLSEFELKYINECKAALHNFQTDNPNNSLT